MPNSKQDAVNVNTDITSVINGMYNLSKYGSAKATKLLDDMAKMHHVNLAKAGAVNSKPSQANNLNEIMDQICSAIENLKMANTVSVAAKKGDIDFKLDAIAIMEVMQEFMQQQTQNKQIIKTDAEGKQLQLLVNRIGYLVAVDAGADEREARVKLLSKYEAVVRTAHDVATLTVLQSSASEVYAALNSLTALKQIVKKQDAEILRLKLEFENVSTEQKMHVVGIAELIRKQAELDLMVEDFPSVSNKR